MSCGDPKKLKITTVNLPLLVSFFSLLQASMHAQFFLLYRRMMFIKLQILRVNFSKFKITTECATCMSVSDLRSQHHLFSWPVPSGVYNRARETESGSMHCRGQHDV